MKAVILAAGKGTRIGEFTAKNNKCLIPVEGQPLITYHIDNFARVECITECIIVVGYKAEGIIQQVGHSRNGMKITYCYQPEDKERGIIPSIESAIDVINDDFILALGDEFVYKNHYQETIEEFYKRQLQCMVGVIETENINEVKKNYTFRIRENGCLYDFVEKPEIPYNSYLGTGNIIFRKDVCELLSLVPMNSIRRERELVDLFQRIIQKGNLIHPYIVGEAYFNINTIHDYERLKQFLNSRRDNEYVYE